MPSIRSLATALGLLGAVAGATLAYSIYVEPRRFSLRQRDIGLQRLPEALAGLRILHISDLHLHAGETEKVAMLRRLSTVDADLLVITGDFTDKDEDIPACIESLSGLRGRYGTYAVLGNHDVCTYRGSRLHVWREESHNYKARRGLPSLIQRLGDIGIDLLRNENRSIMIGDQPLWVAGVDDPHQGFDDLGRAMIGIPGDATVVLLAHSPEILANLGDRRPDLILSGHTHGGQVVFPIVGALVTRTAIPLKKACGTFDHDGTVMHISPGLGGSITMRFNRPPEAELLVLRQASPAPRELVLRRADSSAQLHVG